MDTIAAYSTPIAQPQYSHERARLPLTLSGLMCNCADEDEKAENNSLVETAFAVNLSKEVRDLGVSTSLHWDSSRSIHQID